MSHFLTEEQLIIKNTAKKFAENEVASVVESMDKQNEFPMEVFRRAGELGFTGLCVPEEYGGAGTGYTEECLVQHEISKVSPGFALILDAHMLGQRSIMMGSDELKEKYLEYEKTLQEKMKSAAIIQKEVETRLEKLDRDYALFVVDGFIENLKTKYQSRKICSYLDQVKESVVHEVERFKRGPVEYTPAPFSALIEKK